MDATVMPVKGRQGKPSQRTWHSVEVRCPEPACAAALALQGRRFLSNETPPQLPLADCSDPAHCQCRYGHHDDRRDGPRRDADTSASAIFNIPDRNNRLGRGRRDED